MPRTLSPAAPALALPVTIETKLWPPLVREGALPRTELVEALQRSIEAHAVTLVSAGAGFGKTSMLAAWYASRPVPEAIAWLRLDPADDDPVRLWAHLSETLRRTYRDRLEQISDKLPPATSGPAALVNELAAIRAPRVLVLDDFHLVTNLACSEGLDAFIAAMPPSVRIVISSRADPPISLARLRAAGQLGEIRAEELAFTFAEARELAARTPEAHLGHREAERLRRLTEGWPAGMYLALLAASRHEDSHGFVGALTGDTHTIADYLTTEVLAGLDEETSTFLVETSVLEELDGPVCDAMLESSGSIERLQELARSNLFLIPLDDRRERFRYHQLFRDVLQLQLRRADPERRRELHLRASRWYASAGGRPALAIEHALAAEAWAEAGSLVEDTELDALQKGRWATVLGWVSRLPDAELSARPLLPATGAAVAAALGSPWSELERWLVLSDIARAQHPDAWTPTAQGYVTFAQAFYVRGDVGAAVAAAEHLVQLSATAAGGNRAIAHGVLAWALYLAGDHTAAASEAEAALASEDVNSWAAAPRQAITVLSLLASEAGEPERALRLAEQALVASELLDMPGGAIAAARAHLAYALALAGAGRIAEAEAEAELAPAVAGHAPRDSASRAYALIALASIRRRGGRLKRARESLDDAERWVGGFVDAGWLEELLERESRELRAAEASGTAVEPLTQAELGVLRLLAGDQSQREIAAALFVSENTVKTHCRSIYRKLHVRARPDAVARASDLGLLDGESPG